MSSAPHWSAAAVVGGMYLLVGVASGQTWTTTSAPTNNWSAVASSADGSKLVAVSANQGTAYTGSIYTSTNSGVTWISNNVPALNWNCVASSVDGTRLIAGSTWGSTNVLYSSTNSGQTWQQRIGAPDAEWSSLACSADGNKLAAAGESRTNYQSGHIYISTNSGATWAESGAPDDPYWNALTSSADGTRLVAGTLPPSQVFSGNYATGNSIYTSTNSGVTWDEHSVPYGAWVSAASSADGTKLAVASYAWFPDWHVLTSTDKGVNWSETAKVPKGLLVSSANGVLAILASGTIFTSIDSGTTWVTNSAPISSWASIACSADGTRFVAAARFGGIYIAQFAPTPSLNIMPSKQMLLISWIVPSMNFHLQERRDLISGEWHDVIPMPILNLTNLRYELPVSPTNSGDFYRLANP
jgi:hypothetical protein